MDLDLRNATALFCAGLAIAIAISAVLRSHVSRVQWIFAGFATSVGLWYLAQVVYRFVQNRLWEVATGLLAVLTPLFAVMLFSSIVPRPSTSVMSIVDGSTARQPPSPLGQPKRRFKRVAPLLAL